MVQNSLKSSVLLLIFSCFCLNQSVAQNSREHIEVAMRMIGHQLLLNAEDSSSRVLPIESDTRKFRVRFESEFSFLPSELVASIDSIVRITDIAKRYRVELENSQTQKTVYSYEIDSTQSTEAACGPRRQGKAKYDVLFTILDSGSIVSSANTVKRAESPIRDNTLWVVNLLPVGILFFILVGIGIYFWRRSKRTADTSNEIQIGTYRFDQHNMKLIFKTTSIDLTGKETDLLVLLYSSVNKTLERDEILKVVWGDEGDYVGRTLDVFISKLRKKFSEDPSVKIVNVRGVGYKMMLSK